MERIRLVIVDENTRVRQALETRLSVIPEFEILGSAGTVGDVQRLVAQSVPDVILIEPKRLNGEGYDLIRALTNTPDPPMVIVLSSYYDDQDAFMVNELGISCFLLKEIDSSVLIDAIMGCHQDNNHAH